MNDNAYPYIACPQINRAKIKTCHEGKECLTDGRYYHIRCSYKIKKMSQPENYRRSYDRRPYETFSIFPTVKHLTDTSGASFLKNRPEFNSAVTYPISQSAIVSRT